jgi:hypothetical protein
MKIEMEESNKKSSKKLEKIKSGKNKKEIRTFKNQ